MDTRGRGQISGDTAARGGLGGRAVPGGWRSVARVDGARDGRSHAVGAVAVEALLDVVARVPAPGGAHPSRALEHLRRHRTRCASVAQAGSGGRGGCGAARSGAETTRSLRRTRQSASAEQRAQRGRTRRARKTRAFDASCVHARAARETRVFGAPRVQGTHGLNPDENFAANPFPKSPCARKYEMELGTAAP